MKQEISVAAEPPVLTDEKFMANVREARENGHDIVCVECGSGIFDDSDIHDRECSSYESPV